MYGTQETRHVLYLNTRNIKIVPESVWGWDFAEWLERLYDVVATRNCPGFDPNILRHSGIWGAADEAVWNIVHKKEKKSKKSPLSVSLWKKENFSKKPYRI